VKGNPSELVWGKPYDFVEVKGRQEMSLTGNLKAMLDYVDQYGGHIEVWFRSAKHPAGATRLTKQLQTYLNKLANSDNLKLRAFPE